MKTLRITLSLALASFVFAGFAQASNEKPADAAAGCCKKAAAADKTCTHGCCTTAAKENKNCEKCGGKNAPKPEQAS